MKNGITEEACSNYQAKGWKEGVACDAQMICKDCKPGSLFKKSSCAVPATYNTFTVDKWGPINKTTAPKGDIELMMMNEIAANGPLACGIDASPIEAKGFQADKIVTAQGKSIGHDISVIG